MNSTSQHCSHVVIDGFQENPQAETFHHRLEGHAGDWLEDYNQTPVKRFHSFASIRQQLGQRKKVLQQEREQRELMEQPQNEDTANEVVHELGKPFLSSFTSCCLRNVQNKWKVEERETIVFENDENFSPQSVKKANKNTNDQSTLGASISKRAKKKRDKKKWMSRVKNRALALSGKSSNIQATSGSTKKKKKKLSFKSKSNKSTSQLKASTKGSASLPISIQQRMAMRLEQRAQHKRSSKPKRQEDSVGDDYDISSADRVAVGVDEELLLDATNDFVPSLVYPKGIQPGTGNNNKERARPSAYTPYCYSSDDDSSRREKSLQPPQFKDKNTVVQAVGSSYQGDFSEDSSLGSIPSVSIHLDEVSSNQESRDDSGFAGVMSQKSALDQSFEENGKIRIGRTIVGVLDADADAESTSSIESSTESIPSLLKDSILPCDILHIGDDEKQDDDESVDLISPLEKVDTNDLKQKEDVKDDQLHTSVSFESSIPSPATLEQQRQAHHYQPAEQSTNDSFMLTEERNLEARRLGEQMEEAASPPPSPIQPTILEVESYNDSPIMNIDDIPVEEKQKKSMFRKLLSCGSGIKTMIPAGASKAFKEKASSFKRKSKTKSFMQGSSSTSHMNFSFITTSTPSGITFTSSPTSTTPGSLTSSARSTSWGSSPCRTDENAKTSPAVLQTPVKKKSNARIHGVSPKRTGTSGQDPFQTPPKSSPKNKKAFDYRRPTPAKENQRTKSTSTKSSPVSLILDSFERLTKKNRSPRRTRRLKKIMSTAMKGKRLPMLIALGLAALFQSVLNNLDATKALTMFCAGSCAPLMLLWDGGMDAAVGGMTGFAQAMIAQG